MKTSFTTQTIAVLFLASRVRAIEEEEESVGDWLLNNIIMLLGLTVLVLVILWCICSYYAGRNEKKQQEKRAESRREAEEQELQIQTRLYQRQEEQQRKIMWILQERLTEKSRRLKKDELVLMPAFIHEKLSVDQMQRDELEAEFSKITPEQVDQLDEQSKAEIKVAQDKIAQLEEKLELYQLERAYKRWF